MDRDALERAQQRLTAARESADDDALLHATLERARVGLEELAQATAELEANVPGNVERAIAEGMRSQVLPVARHLAEVRGLSAQNIRRLERLQTDVDADRRARIEDLALLVDLIGSGWQGVERRLDRLERSLDRLERTFDRPAAAVYRLEDRQVGAAADHV